MAIYVGNTTICTIDQGGSAEKCALLNQSAAYLGEAAEANHFMANRALMTHFNDSSAYARLARLYNGVITCRLLDEREARHYAKIVKQTTRLHSLHFDVYHYQLPVDELCDSILNHATTPYALHFTLDTSMPDPRLVRTVAKPIEHIRLRFTSIDAFLPELAKNNKLVTLTLMESLLAHPPVTAFDARDFLSALFFTEIVS